jgi:hypothetical protein
MSRTYPANNPPKKQSKNIQSILGRTVARLQKTALQETWDVRDIALAAGANLSDLVAWPMDFRDFPKGTIMDLHI